MSEQAPFFPEYACEYSRALARSSKRFALQISAAPEREQDDEARSTTDRERYSCDPFGELGGASRCHGLKQRFDDRVLIMTTDRCFLNCRHCTRRGLLGRSKIVSTQEQLQQCVDYVVAHPLVRDVLLSGGDVLTLTDEEVLRFIDAFASLEQIDVVRLCTRAVCANPARITREFAKRLAVAGRGKLWLNTQFNCADEVTSEAREAAASLVENGIPVSCQTVLLKGVNDEPEEMLRLLKALSAARIRPYYVFMCDPVAGIERFRVPLEKALEIERYCAERIGGLALPRFVADIPGAKRKMPIAEIAAAT